MVGNRPINPYSKSEYTSNRTPVANKTSERLKHKSDLAFRFMLGQAVGLGCLRGRRRKMRLSTLAKFPL
jgi:hypothetical protein